MSTCAARRPGPEFRPVAGRNSLPCKLEMGHGTTHQNALGDHWEGQREHETRRYLGEQEERVIEWRRIARRLEVLYATQANGDDTTLTRQRIERLEALQQALTGFPEALTQ